MNKSKGGVLRALATRSVIAVIPAAMVSAYASGIFVSPPRIASYEFTPVAEIVVAPNTVGVAESPLYGASLDEINQQLDALQAIGVQNIRVFVPWGLIEQTNNNYDWTYIDRVMAAAAVRNMGVLAEVNGTPNWAAVDPANPSFPPGSSPPNPTAFVDFMNAFMAHTTPVNGANTSYASIVSAYEIWNEPNYIQFSNPINPEAYAALLAAVYPAIKLADPTATVVAGAVGATQDGFFTMNPVTFVQRMLDAGAGPYFDALSFHPYSDEVQFSGSCPTCPPTMMTPREQLDAIKALIGITKTIWISEYGVNSTDAATYQKQVEWITDLLDSWQSYSQAGPVFVYTGQDQAGSTDSGAHMGLWTDTGGKKFYTTPDGVVHSVSDELAAWIAAHPQVLPPPLGGIVNPLAALFQTIVAQLQSFASSVQAFFNSIVTAITNLFGGFASPAAVPAASQTLALRAASVATADATSQTAELDPAAAATEEVKKSEGGTALAAAEGTAAEATATEEAAAAEVPAEVTKAPATPAVVEPVVEPAVETTVPTKTPEPATTEPTATPEPATGTVSGTTPSTEASSEPATKTEPSDTTKSDDAKSDDTKSDGAAKSGDATKSGDAARSIRDASHKDGYGRHARTSDAPSVKVKAEPVTAGAPAASEGTSDAAGGEAS